MLEWTKLSTTLISKNAAIGDKSIKANFGGNTFVRIALKGANIGSDKLKIICVNAFGLDIGIQDKSTLTRITISITRSK